MRLELMEYAINDYEDLAIVLVQVMTREELIEYANAMDEPMTPSVPFEMNEALNTIWRDTELFGVPAVSENTFFAWNESYVYRALAFDPARNEYHLAKAQLSTQFED